MSRRLRIGVALLGLLIAVPIAASTFGGSSGGGSSAVDLTAVASNVVPDANNTRSNGLTGTRWANVFATNVEADTLQSKSSSAVTVKGNVTDGATAVGVALDSSTLANASAKLVSFREAGVEYLYINNAGTFIPVTNNALSLGSSTNGFSTVYAQVIRNNTAIRDTNNVSRFTSSSFNTYVATDSGNAGEAAHRFSITIGWPFSTSEIVSFHSSSAEVANINRYGLPQYGIGNTTAAPTCDSTQRGRIWVFEGGAGVTDTATMCRKDASDNYAWVAIY